MEDLREIAEELVDVAVIEQSPNIEGRTMGMVLAPSKQPAKKKTTEAEKTPESEPTVTPA